MNGMLQVVTFGHTQFQTHRILSLDAGRECIPTRFLESTVNAACSEVSWGLGRPYSLQLQALAWESGLLLLKHS